MLRFLLLLVLFGGMYAMQAWLLTKAVMRGIRYSCRFDREEVMEGDTVELIEEIENRSLLPLAWLRSEYSVSKYLEFAGAHSVVTDRTRFVSSFFILRSRTRLQRRWHVRCTRRGEYTVEKVMLVTSDLFGTAKTSRPAEALGGVLTVLPVCCEGAGRLLPVQSLSEGWLPVRESLLTDPFTAAGSRPYTGREPLRRMDWKATARAGSLMVRREEPAGYRELCICFTAQQGEFGRLYVPEEAGEHTIRVIAALIRECVDRGIPFSLQSCCTSHGELLTVPCGLHNEVELLRSLAALDTAPELSLRRCVSIPPGAGVLLVVPFVSEDVLRLKAQYPDAAVILTYPGDPHGIAVERIFGQEVSECER